MDNRTIQQFGTLIAAAFPATCFGYIDPTGGTIVVQLILGGIAGLIIAVKVYWTRITQFFRKK